MKFSAISQKDFKTLSLAKQTLINKAYQKTNKAIAKIISVTFDTALRNERTRDCWNIYKNTVDEIVKI